jgi:polygalacturonase
MDLTNIPSMPTTDGIDPDTCDGVDIVGVSISVGDDCIAIKSGTLDQARKYKRPCKNIVIRNCLMQNGHGGVVFGSELSGGIENVRVSQCFFDGTDRGLRIKTRRGRGRVGVTDNIILEDIVMRNVKVPFVINMYYNMGDETGHTEYVYTRKKLPIDERTPYIGSFTFKNMLCNGVCYSAGAFYGLPESPIESITLENINIEYDKTCKPGFADMQEVDTKVKNQGLYFEYVKTVTLKNVNIVSPEGEEIIAKGVENIIKDKK